MSFGRVIFFPVCFYFRLKSRKKSVEWWSKQELRNWIWPTCPDVPMITYIHSTHACTHIHKAKQRAVDFQFFSL